MSGRGSAFVRWIAAWLALGLAMVRAQAADAPAAAVTPTEGLDAAKAQYDTIKTTRSTSQEQQKLAVPVVPPLELKLDDIPFAPAGLNTNGRDAAKSPNGQKSPNWLLEAMEDAKKKDAHRDRDAKGGSRSLNASEEATVDDDVTGMKASNSNLTPNPGKDLRDDRTLGEANPDVVNPLASYMASWMSAGDLALLSPKSNSRTEVVTVPQPSGENAAPAGWDANAALFAPSATSERSAPAAKEEANPYLAPLALTPAPALPPPPNLSVPTPVPAVSPPATEPESARTPTPAEQFRNSRDDEKLFKPLKRF